MTTKNNPAEAVKEAAIEMIRNGASVMKTAEVLAAMFGESVSRLIMCDIALDLGMYDQTREYLESIK